MPYQSKTPMEESETSNLKATSISEVSQRINLRQASLKQQEEDTQKAVSAMLNELEQSIRNITQDAQKRMLSDTDSLLNQHQKRLSESLKPLESLASRIEQSQKQHRESQQKQLQQSERRQARMLYRILPALMLLSLFLGMVLMYQILNR